jgi:hypothetical protein
MKTNAICSECSKSINLKKDTYVESQIHNILVIEFEKDLIAPQYFHVECYNKLMGIDNNIKKVIGCSRYPKPTPPTT